MSRTVDIGYQEDAAGQGTPDKEHVTEEQKLVMAQVEEVLNMPGWAVMHSLIMDKIEQSQRKLNAFSSTADEVRFHQGVVDGLLTVRSTFIQLAKEEGYVG